MIAEVRKEREHKKNIGGEWHTDHSYDEIPALGSILLAHEVPRGRRRHGVRQHVRRLRGAVGRPEGDARATARRPFEPARLRLRGPDAGERRSRHPIGNPELAIQDAVHPVVITHPESGRPALYVNRASPCASRAGRTRSHARCSTISTATRHGPSSCAGSAGSRARSRSGTIGPPGTTRSTTIRASSA